DTLDMLEQQLTRLLEMRVPGNMRRAAARSAMAQPLSLSAACNGFSGALRADSASTPLLALQQLAAGGKFDAVRQRLDDLRAQRMAVAASDVSIDQALQESLLRMAAGDSALAMRGLSEALDGVSSNSGFRLEELGQCAALARGRVLLVRWQRGESGTPAVKRMSGELDALWKRADVMVRELVGG
ncbi:MAG: hypothetical protein ABIZ91_05525, partial [Gemmatimonadaceae bacterium]